MLRRGRGRTEGRKADERKMTSICSNRRYEYVYILHKDACCSMSGVVAAFHDEGLGGGLGMSLKRSV